jgi:membrane-bound metal-dependent hydrolase YbcI (DUF457 family)
LDIGWSSLVLAGVEKFRFDPALPGSPLDLYHMPYTHSLPAALIWSGAAGLAARLILKVPGGAAVLIGLTVFSHWILDFLVHRPDLELWPGQNKVGLAWWNFPTPELILEFTLLALAAVAWTANRKGEGLKAWPVAALVAFLCAQQLINALLPGGGSTAGMAMLALVTYLLTTAAAKLTELGRRG